MPAKMSLEELEHAIKRDEVKHHLDYYALGLLIDEQRRARKPQSILNQTLAGLNSSTPAYQLKSAELLATESKPELGFYYTISLLDQLGAKHPVQAKQMIEAILSFDTMGRYLLCNTPVIVEGVPFVLDEVLTRYGIDGDVLKKLAKQNLARTTSLATEVFEKSCDFPVLASIISLPKNLDEESEALFKELISEFKKTREVECFIQKMDKNILNYDLVSSPATAENIHAFLHTTAEIFAHAKMQDSSKLDKLAVPMPAGANACDYSLVGFFGNTISSWLISSLIQAPTVDVFTKRIEFIMRAFSAANKKIPDLPISASADMYIPLFTLSITIPQSPLQDHPAVKLQLAIMHDMAMQHREPAMTKYLNDHIKLSVGGEKSRLPPMRMALTAKVELSKQMAELLEHMSNKKLAHEYVMRGKKAFDYFKPAKLPAVPNNKISEEAQALFTAQPLIDHLFQNVEFYQISSFLTKCFPLYKEDDPLGRRLRTLESALFNQNPRIFFFTPMKELLNYEGKAALHFIKQAINSIRFEQMRNPYNNPDFRVAVTQWCSAIESKLGTLLPRLDSKGRVRAESVPGASTKRSTITFFPATSDKPITSDVNEKPHRVRVRSRSISDV